MPIQISGGVQLSGPVLLDPTGDSGGSGGDVVGKIAIGAQEYDSSPSASSGGGVFIYDQDGTNEVLITQSDASSSDNLGESVALSTTKVIAGAPGDDNKGSVYIFDHDGTNQIKIVPSDRSSQTNYTEFGKAVATNGTKIAVGYNHYSSTSASAVYIYDMDGTNEVKISGSDNGVGQFGRSLAMTDSKIIVGCQGVNSYAGAIYVYDLDGSNEVKITPSDGASYDYFGESVATNGSKIVVGARGKNSYHGAAYLYDLDGSNELKITRATTSESTFGYSVAITSSKIIVGAPEFRNSSNVIEGAMYTFDIDGTNEAIMQASDLGNYAEFQTYGRAVGALGNKAFAGMANQPKDINYGAVYQYDMDGSNEFKFTSSNTPTNGQKYGFSIATVVTG